jgi:putative N6-adenine-specific DNA methylase
MENNFKMVAETFFGFEEILAKELQNVGRTRGMGV